MPIPRDLLEDVRTYVDVEIQAGRRRAPLDPAAVAEFLAAAPAAAPVSLPLGGQIHA